ncbi:MAG: phage holin family protein [Proteiniphilum sp.]|nr:phage holin family protein [Proteiniphilum sp.]
MEEKKVSTLFEEMRGDISNFITATLELGKLEVYEKISLASSTITYSLIVAGIALLTLFFILVTVGIYLGEVFQNTWVGFGIVAAFALLVLLIMLLLKKPFKKKVTNRVVSFLMEQNDKDGKNSNK